MFLHALLQVIFVLVLL